MTPSTFVFVRHAEAEGNREHRFIGQGENPLSEEGRRQTEALTNRLISLPLTRLVSSDLRRCRDTIEPLSVAIGVDLELEPRFREIDNGEWQGLLPDEIAEGWPDLWERYRNGEDVQRPGGEKWAEVAARARVGFDELVETADGDTVVVCTHAGIIQALLTWAAGIETTQHFFRGPFGPLANGSLTTIAMPGPRVVAFNDVGHLDRGTAVSQLPFFET